MDSLFGVLKCQRFEGDLLKAQPLLLLQQKLKLLRNQPELKIIHFCNLQSFFRNSTVTNQPGKSFEDRILKFLFGLR